MGMEIGSKSATSGLTKQIYEDLTQVLEDANAFSYVDVEGKTQVWADAQRSEFNARLKDSSYGYAKSIVEHIQDNADVSAQSNVTVDPAFWSWLIALVGILTTAGGVTLSPAMVTFLATNPIPTTLSSTGSVS